jgi:hypothetical protein
VFSSHETESAYTYSIIADRTTDGLADKVYELLGQDNPDARRNAMARMLYNKTQLSVRSYNTSHSARKRARPDTDAFDPTGKPLQKWERDVVADAPGTHMRELRATVLAAAAGMCPPPEEPEMLCIHTDQNEVFEVLIRPQAHRTTKLWAHNGAATTANPSLEDVKSNTENTQWIVWVSITGERFAFKSTSDRGDRDGVTYRAAEMLMPRFGPGIAHRYISEDGDDFVLIAAPAADELWYWQGDDPGGTTPGAGPVEYYEFDRATRWTDGRRTIVRSLPVFATINADEVRFIYTRIDGTTTTAVDWKHIHSGSGASSKLYTRCDGEIGPSCRNTRAQILSATPFQDLGCESPFFRDAVFDEFRAIAQEQCNCPLTDDFFEMACFRLSASDNPTAHPVCGGTVVQLSDNAAKWCVAGGSAIAEDAVSATVTAVLKMRDDAKEAARNAAA